MKPLDSSKKNTSEHKLNNTEKNRGIDFIVSGGKRKKIPTISLKINKIISLFKREIDINFNFSIFYRKKENQ